MSFVPLPIEDEVPKRPDCHSRPRHNIQSPAIHLLDSALTPPTLCPAQKCATVRRKVGEFTTSATRLKGTALKKILFLVAAMFVATVVLAACSNDPEATSTPERQQTTPTAEPSPAPTAEPSPTPTDEPSPTSTQAPTPRPTPTPDPSTGISTDPVVSGEDTLSVECPTDGTLDSAAEIISCSALAAEQVSSFSFDAVIDLFALFPLGEDTGDEASLRLSGTMALPDRLRFQVSFGPEGEMFTISGVQIGSDTYVQEPESGLWFRGAPEDASLLTSLQLVGMFLTPSDPTVSLNGTTDLDDGSTAYLMVSEQPPLGGEAGFFLGSGTTVSTLVDVADFLIREVSISTEGLDGESMDFISISYHGYNEVVVIEPPADYLPLPEEPIGPGPDEPPMVVGLARNDDGDVEVLFSKPVFVEGSVDLYVLDPATGGWGLPLIGGSGTNTLTFDADAEGRPSLVLGESQIPWLAFADAESHLVGSEGTRASLSFDVWTYE